MKKGRDGKYVVNLSFRLDEEVTPHLFAGRVAEACGTYGALRPGESVQLRGYLDSWTVLPFDARVASRTARITHSIREWRFEKRPK